MAMQEEIEVMLTGSPFSSNPDDCIGRTIHKGTRTLSDLCRLARERGGADISAEAMEHATLLVLKEAGYQLVNGWSVNLGLFFAELEVRGIFKTLADKFDHLRHHFVVSIRPSPELRKTISALAGRILGEAEAGFFLAALFDLKSRTTNDILTPGKIARLVGGKMKIAGPSPLNRLCFRNVLTLECVVVDMDDISENTKSHLTFLVPNLTPGGWRPEVTTQYAGGNLLKEPRTAVLDRVLTVV